MDDDQQFCLRWNNHQSTLISVFDTLLENETLVDCTLAAEGKFLKAHKVVLSACSPYFATLLSEQYDKHPIFILKDVKYQELRAMMDYMYRGEVNISQDQLAALLKAAESLQIKGLSDNRTGSGNSSSGLGGVSQQQQQQQKLSAEQQHKHISVPGKLMSGSASTGYTLEQTKRSRIGPSSIDSQDLSGSREGSSSPTSRRRKKVRRRSIENVLADNHDNSNSSQVIQAGTSSIVPTTNATGTITAMLPMIGSGVGGTTTTISSSVASTITVAAQQQLQQHQQQQASAATAAAANIITANVTKKTENVKMGGNTDAMNAAVTAVENIQDDNAADSIDEKEMLMKDKQNHKRQKHQHEGVVATSTGKDEIVIEPKSEYDDEGNDENVEDLTLDDEEMGLEDLDHNAGPSHGGEGSSQGYAQWQVDRSQDEVFMAAQEAQQRDPQDLSKKVTNPNKDQKNSIMEQNRNSNNRHSMNGMDAMSSAVAANQINGNKKRFSVSDVSDMLYEFYRANSAAKAPKTENSEKPFRQKSPSSADAAAGGKCGSMQSGMPNEPQTSNTTASKNSNGDEMTNTNTNTNKIGTTKSSITVKKSTTSFHPRVKYSSVVNKSNTVAAAALANMENTPAAIPTSVVVPPPDIKPILPIPASVIKPTTIGTAAAPAAAAIAAALLRDGYHNFQQQLRNQDIFKQQSNLVPLAHNNQSGGSVQPINAQNKGMIFENFDRKENRFSDNENEHSNSEFDEDDDDDDDGRYSGFDDIHLIEGSKSSFNHHPNATMPCLSTDYMSDESQKLMMAAQAQALRHLEYSLSDYGGTNTNEEANYQCRHCGKKYRWKSTLRRHENVECGGKEPAHQCPYCAYKSKQRGNLGVHVRKHHSNLPQLASKRRSKYSQQRDVKIEKTEKAF